MRQTSLYFQLIRLHVTRRELQLSTLRVADWSNSMRTTLAGDWSTSTNMDDAVRARCAIIERVSARAHTLHARRMCVQGVRNSHSLLTCARVAVDGCMQLSASMPKATCVSVLQALVLVKHSAETFARHTQHMCAGANAFSQL
jgi:hypothetical protein